VSDLEAMRALKITSCDVIRLTAGEHRLTSNADKGLVLSTASLSSASPAVPLPPARRTAVRGAWGAEHREVEVGPGAASYLAVSENFNAGWTASLGGHRLESLRLDGWRQGWMVPAGAGGVVRLSFAPGAVFRGFLVGGVVTVALLLLLAFGRRSRSTPHAPPAFVVAPTRLPIAVSATAVFALAFVLGGVFGALAAAILLLVPRRQARLPAVAAAAFAVAGLAVFFSPAQFPGTGSGSFGAPAQAAAVVALVAVAVALIPEPSKSTQPSGR
jgi:arabinofuranan 3-O-arabinosyltransferase